MEGCHGAKIGLLLTKISSIVRFSKFTVCPLQQMLNFFKYTNPPNPLVGKVEGGASSYLLQAITKF